MTGNSSEKVELAILDTEIQGIAIDSESKTITLKAVGTFEVAVSATDVSGNTSEEKVLIVVEDHTQPVLALSQTTFSITAGDTAPNYRSAASASDNVDGDLTASVSVDTSKVNLNYAGTYEVIYSVTDSSGNVTTQSATIIVAAKPQPASTTADSSTQVMITRTGSCYHTHKCGNGTYFWVSFSEAQSRGLRPCQKCY